MKIEITEERKHIISALESLGWKNIVFLENPLTRHIEPYGTLPTYATGSWPCRKIGMRFCKSLPMDGDYADLGRKARGIEVYLAALKQVLDPDGIFPSDSPRMVYAMVTADIPDRLAAHYLMKHIIS